MTVEEKILVDLTASHINGTKPTLETENADFGEVFRLAAIHKLTPLIFSTVKKNGIALPLETEQAMKITSRMQSVGVITRTDAYLKLLDTFKENGLHPITVKGVIVRSLYPEPHARPSADEDIYINKEEKDSFDSILLSMGFTKNQSNDEDDTVTAYTSAATGLHLEVHTSLFPEYPATNIKMNALFSGASDRACSYDVEGHAVASLCPTDHLLFLILHSFKHFIYCGFGLRQIADFVVFARRYKDEIDASAITQSLRSVRADGFFDALLKISLLFFGADKASLGFGAYTPRDYEVDDLAKDVISAGLYGNTDSVRLHSSTITLSAADGKKTGRLASIFPPLKIMKNRYSYVSKCPLLLPVGWAHRIISYLFDSKESSANDAAKSLEIGQKRLDMLKKYGVVDGGAK